MGQFNYIAVEGVPCSGKTSLARFLAEKERASLILDDASSNPFLGDIHQNLPRSAFSAQIFFLVSRYEQLRHWAQPDLFVAKKVTDYIFAKDEIFAKLNLSPREYNLYHSLVKMMKTEIPVPDLVIYLQVSPAFAWERIKQRKAAYHTGITLDHLETLAKAFDQFFFHYTLSPLLIVNTNALDLLNKKGDLELVASELEKSSFGTRYYTPHEKDVLL